MESMNEPRDKNGLTEKEFLAAYKPGNWPRPSCTADLAIIYEAPDLTREILLIKRGGHPSLGKWALPGGFVNPDETVEHAASRELFEETGVGGLRPTLICESSDPGRDPRGWTITSLFGAVVRSKPVTDAGDDARDAKWFGIKYWLEGRHVRFTLTSDEILMNFSASYETIDSGFGETYAITEVSGEGLAFDHAKLTALALLKLAKYGNSEKNQIPFTK